MSTGMTSTVSLSRVSATSRPQCSPAVTVSTNAPQFPGLMAVLTLFVSRQAENHRSDRSAQVQGA